MGGYRDLLVYRLSVTIYDLTVLFCEKFLADYAEKRTVEQMVQAARSGKQNIAEGSKEISASSEMLLSSVSRSSYTELVEDYEDFLRRRGLRVWDKNDPKALRVRAYREQIGTPTNLTNLSNWTNLDFGNPENLANLLICLCYKQGYLLDQFLRSKEKRFVQSGGYRENLFRKRREYTGGRAG